MPSRPNPNHRNHFEFQKKSLNGTPTKRQVSKRQVSKRLVSKRPVSKRQVHKTSGLQNVRFKTSGFKMSIF
jgi:hypothetical protein